MIDSWMKCTQERVRVKGVSFSQQQPREWNSPDRLIRRAMFASDCG